MTSTQLQSGLIVGVKGPTDQLAPSESLKSESCCNGHEAVGKTQLTVSRLLFDAVARRRHRGCRGRAEGLRELLFRGGGALHRAGIFKTLLWTQVDFNGSILTF